MKMDLRFKKLYKTAHTPTFGTKYSAGMDLYNSDTTTTEIAPHETKFVHTGLVFEIPIGHVGLVYARSGLACKRGLRLANSTGVIDSDYRGEVMIALHNDSNAIQTINPGERIAQMIIMPYPSIDLVEVSEIDNTERGVGGFGSTGR